MKCLKLLIFQKKIQVLSNTINILCLFQASNILFVDQPTGTGFSYSSSEEDIRHTEEGVSNDLYDFIQVSFAFAY